MAAARGSALGLGTISERDKNPTASGGRDRVPGDRLIGVENVSVSPQHRGHVEDDRDRGRLMASLHEAEGLLQHPSFRQSYKKESDKSKSFRAAESGGQSTDGVLSTDSSFRIPGASRVVDEFEATPRLGGTHNDEATSRAIDAARAAASNASGSPLSRRLGHSPGGSASGRLGSRRGGGGGLAAMSMPHIGAEMHAAQMKGSVTTELSTLRREVDAHRRHLEHFDEAGVTLPMLRAAMAIRLDDARKEWGRAIHVLKQEYNQLLDAKATQEALDDLDKRKVDWENLKSTILTLTRSNISRYVEAESDNIKVAVTEKVREVFDVDPSLRADMIEVSKLSRRVKLAEETSSNLAAMLQTGIEQRVRSAAESLSQSTDKVLQKFRGMAASVQEETTEKLEGAESRLSMRVQAKIDSMGDKTRELQIMLEKHFDDKLNLIEAGIISKFETQLADVSMRSRRNNTDATNALQLVKNLDRIARDHESTARRLEDMVEHVAARAEGLYVMVGGIMGEVADIKKVGGREKLSVKELSDTVVSQQRTILKLQEDLKHLTQSFKHQTRKQKSEVHHLEHTLVEDVKRLKGSMKKLSESGGGRGGGGGLGGIGKSELLELRRSITSEFSDSLRKMGRDIVSLGDRIMRSTAALEDKVTTHSKVIQEVSTSLDSSTLATEQKIWAIQQEISGKGGKVPAGPPPGRGRRSKSSTIAKMLAGKGRRGKKSRTDKKGKDTGNEDDGDVDEDGDYDDGAGERRSSVTDKVSEELKKMQKNMDRLTDGLDDKADAEIRRQRREEARRQRARERRKKQRAAGGDSGSGSGSGSGSDGEPSATEDAKSERRKRAALELAEDEELERELLQGVSGMSADEYDGMASDSAMSGVASTRFGNESTTPRTEADGGPTQSPELRGEIAPELGGLTLSEALSTATASAKASWGALADLSRMYTETRARMEQRKSRCKELDADIKSLSHAIDADQAARDAAMEAEKLATEGAGLSMAGPGEMPVDPDAATDPVLADEIRRARVEFARANAALEQAESELAEAEAERSSLQTQLKDDEAQLHRTESAMEAAKATADSDSAGVAAATLQAVRSVAEFANESNIDEINVINEETGELDEEATAAAREEKAHQLAEMAQSVQLSLLELDSGGLFVAQPELKELADSVAPVLEAVQKSAEPAPGLADADSDASGSESSDVADSDDSALWTESENGDVIGEDGAAETKSSAAAGDGGELSATVKAPKKTAQKHAATAPVGVGTRLGPGQAVTETGRIVHLDEAPSDERLVAIVPPALPPLHSARRSSHDSDDKHSKAAREAAHNAVDALPPAPIVAAPGDTITLRDGSSVRLPNEPGLSIAAPDGTIVVAAAPGQTLLTGSGGLVRIKAKYARAVHTDDGTIIASPGMPVQLPDGSVVVAPGRPGESLDVGDVSETVLVAAKPGQEVTTSTGKTVMATASACPNPLIASDGTILAAPGTPIVTASGEVATAPAAGETTVAADGAVIVGVSAGSLASNADGVVLRVTPEAVANAAKDTVKLADGSVVAAPGALVVLDDGAVVAAPAQPGQTMLAADGTRVVAAMPGARLVVPEDAAVAAQAARGDGDDELEDRVQISITQARPSKRGIKGLIKRKAKKRRRKTRKERSRSDAESGISAVSAVRQAVAATDGTVVASAGQPVMLSNGSIVTAPTEAGEVVVAEDGTRVMAANGATQSRGASPGALFGSGKSSVRARVAATVVVGPDGEPLLAEQPAFQARKKIGGSMCLVAEPGAPVVTSSGTIVAAPSRPGVVVTAPDGTKVTSVAPERRESHSSQQRSRMSSLARKAAHADVAGSDGGDAESDDDGDTLPALKPVPPPLEVRGGDLVAVANAKVVLENGAVVRAPKNPGQSTDVNGRKLVSIPARGGADGVIAGPDGLPYVAKQRAGPAVVGLDGAMLAPPNMRVITATGESVRAPALPGDDVRAKDGTAVVAVQPGQPLTSMDGQPLPVIPRVRPLEAPVVIADDGTIYAAPSLPVALRDGSVLVAPALPGDFALATDGRTKVFAIAAGEVVEGLLLSRPHKQHAGALRSLDGAVYALSNQPVVLSEGCVIAAPGTPGEAVVAEDGTVVRAAHPGQLIVLEDESIGVVGAIHLAQAPSINNAVGGAGAASAARPAGLGTHATPLTAALAAVSSAQAAQDEHARNDTHGTASDLAVPVAVAASPEQLQRQRRRDRHEQRRAVRIAQKKKAVEEQKKAAAERAAHTAGHATVELASQLLQLATRTEKEAASLLAKVDVSRMHEAREAFRAENGMPSISIEAPPPPLQTRKLEPVEELQSPLASPPPTSGAAAGDDAIPEIHYRALPDVHGDVRGAGFHTTGGERSEERSDPTVAVKTATPPAQSGSPRVSAAPPQAAPATPPKAAIETHSFAGDDTDDGGASTTAVNTARPGSHQNVYIDFGESMREHVAEDARGFERRTSGGFAAAAARRAGRDTVPELPDHPEFGESDEYEEEGATDLLPPGGLASRTGGGKQDIRKRKPQGRLAAPGSLGPVTGPTPSGARHPTVIHNPATGNIVPAMASADAPLTPGEARMEAVKRRQEAVAARHAFDFDRPGLPDSFTIEGRPKQPASKPGAWPGAADASGLADA